MGRGSAKGPRGRGPPGIVLADSAYGTGSDFRLELRRMGLHYAVGVDPKSTGFEVGQALQRGGAAISVRKLAMKLKE